LVNCLFEDCGGLIRIELYIVDLPCVFDVNWEWRHESTMMVIEVVEEAVVTRRGYEDKN